MKSDIAAIIEWDIPTWQKALKYWSDEISRHQFAVKKGLELGSRNGGLSLFFAQQHGAKMYCSDFGFPTEKAKNLHKIKGISELISYHDINATKIPFEDNYFDFIVFKSMLGAVGAKNRFDLIQQAINEIHRVLKPGGVVFFAENFKGSPLHQWARLRFIPWGKSWNYLSLEEMKILLNMFEKKEIHSTGFLTAFIPNSRILKQVFARIDQLLFFIPRSWRYVGYGYAVKRNTEHP